MSLIRFVHRFRLAKRLFFMGSLVVSAGACYHRPVRATGVVGAASAPDSAAGVADPLDPAGLYARSGLIAESTPVAFVGEIRFFATGSPDSTLVLLALSLANRALAFTGDGEEGQRATYDVVVDVRRGAETVRHLESRETVRVASFRETSRADQSIIYQRYFILGPGQYVLGLSLKDGETARTSNHEAMLTVPRLGAGMLSVPTAVFDAEIGRGIDALPRLVVDPRATTVFGQDSLARVYIEGYHLAAGARLAVSVASDRIAVWRDTILMSGAGAVTAGEVSIPISQVGVGQLTVCASLVGGSDTVRSPLFVSFGDQLAVGSFDEMLSYLRYFATTQRLGELRNAPIGTRAAAWASFWRDTDPIPATPEHEGLHDYFGRMQLANARFREDATSGWLTDRGMVYITLGDPDQLLEQGELNQVSQRGRAQAWVYSRFGLEVIFVDESGFGRWRLTTSSEADFQSVAERTRAH